MEAAWERKEDYVALSLEEARRLLAPARYGVRSLVLIEEGKANTNYLVETDQGPMVLRLAQRTDPKEDLIYLAPLDVPTPELRYVGGRFALYTWMPGITLEKALAHRRDLPYKKIARDLAQARRAMDRTLCRSAGFFDAETPLAAFDLSGNHENPLVVKHPWPSAIEGLLGWLRHRLPAARLAKPLRERVVWVVEDAEPRLQSIAGPPVLVHGDFKASNLLVDESGLTAVLDWEFAHGGTWLSDVGQLLRHPESLPPGFEEAFLDELGATPDAALLARTLDLTNLVDFLAGEKGQPTMRRDATRRIEEVCARYEARFLSRGDASPSLP